MKHLKFAKQPKEQAKIQRKQILNKEKQESFLLLKETLNSYLPFETF